ncbi:MAG: N-acetylmuramoyl-L-alanine amidase [Chloroflexi bacterium]|nr:N-acetylmuramoyl-L-alanine amidase [Chloroflexota bacterium]
MTEPNHLSGGPGWGVSAEHARDFRLWYHLTLRLLRQEFPTLELGFPALCAVPDLKTDLVWLDVCKDAVEASDFLAVHCYWQYENMTSPDWGYRFLQYHARFPDKTLWITEFGDSTPGVSHEKKAEEYLAFWKEVGKYGYVAGAAPFIIGGSDDWREFSLGEPEARAARIAASRERLAGSREPLAGSTGLRDEKVACPLFSRPAPCPLLPATRLGGAYQRRDQGQIEGVVIHHTAVNADLSAQDIARYHVERNGWPGIGYHFLVHQNGDIDCCNDLEAVSYHADGQEKINGVGMNNWRYVGVALNGCFTEGRAPTAAQMLAARWLIASIEYRLGRRLAVLGHKELGVTRCPGDNWAEWKPILDCRL